MGFRSSFTKDELPAQAVHQELTESARTKLVHIVHTEFDSNDLRVAFNEATQREKYDDFLDYKFGDRNERSKFILKADTKIVFAYLEHLLALREYRSYRGLKNKILNAVDKIRNLLEVEAILWQLETDAEGHIRFRPISSEEMKESTNDVRDLALSSEWRDCLEPYVKALDMYADGKYSFHMIEKLNLAIENVVKRICIEEGWTKDESSSSGKYIQKMKDNDFFEQNNIMEQELNHLLNSMDLMRKKIEGDRKRHEDINRNYATLILHQSSAYIYFLIKTFEEY